jgi:serine protease AprX
MESCPVCNLAVSPEQIQTPEVVDESTRRLLSVNARGWDPEKGICDRCLTYFKQASDVLASRFPQFATQKLKILPTPFRLDAPDEFRGRGVTIAFLDSGFYAHPDLTQPRNRILTYVNVVGQGPSDLSKPDVSSWHGMMTSVVGAGNGFLSGGLYRGIASEADLVLIKVGSASRVRHEDIALGLRWVIKNREAFNIRIVNISMGGDYEGSYLDDPLSIAAEDAAREGIVVVAAAGNAGDRESHPVLPPASAPSVIAVGGLDDRNTLDHSDDVMYHSSYGPTIDGLQKPEVIAPGIWLAAPILPGTVTAEQAALLSELDGAADGELARIIRSHPGVDAELEHAADLEPYLLRHLIWIKERDNNVISGNYKHVDGTSFAAPIVSSIAAQMIEVCPGLKPHQVKRALIQTAARLPGVDVDKQGWGMVSPPAAVKAAVAMSQEPPPQ